MIKILIVLAIVLQCFSCAQEKDNKTGERNNKSGEQINKPGENDIIVSDGCEGCEAVYESPVLFEKLSHNVTLPDYNEAGPKIDISGVVYLSDGVTPAPNVVLYLYHTDQNGYYSAKGNETGWGKRHGYIRGWLKTNDKGEYKFYTLRPAPYPNSSIPAHIHTFIKEPGKKEYWIEDYVFDDDKFVDEAYRKRAENRGGDGILKLIKKENGIYAAERNIVLGKNISNYK